MTLISFADDVSMVVTAKTEEILAFNGNTRFQHVTYWTVGRKLQLAREKTEQILLTIRGKLGLGYKK